MKKDQKGFGVIEIIIILVILAIIGIGIWYVLSRNTTTPPPTSTPSSQTTDPYANWKTVTFTPENLKIKLPSSVSTDETVVLQNEGSAVIKLDKGYSLYVTQIGDPKTDNSYGNTTEATAYDSFTSGSEQYYITNSTTALDVSTCQTKVCALSSKVTSNKSVLVQVYYRNPAMTGQQAPDPIPANDDYLDTVKQILKSITY